MSAQGPTILVDTNVWLDNYLPNRMHAAQSRAFLDAAIRANAQLMYPASIVKDVFYLVGRELKRLAREAGEQVSQGSAEAIQQMAWAVVDNMAELATPVGMDMSDIWMASKWRAIDADLEDNLVRAAAKRANVDLLVTWDQGMLSRAIVPTVTPEVATIQLTLQ